MNIKNAKQKRKIVHGDNMLAFGLFWIYLYKQRTVLLFIPPIRGQITETRGKTRGLLYVHNCFELFCPYVHAL